LRIDGDTFSTTSRRKPGGISPVANASVVAFTAPQLSWPSTTIRGVSSTYTAYSMDPSTAVSMM